MGAHPAVYLASVTSRHVEPQKVQECTRSCFAAICLAMKGPRRYKGNERVFLGAISGLWFGSLCWLGRGEGRSLAFL